MRNKPLIYILVLFVSTLMSCGNDVNKNKEKDTISNVDTTPAIKKNDVTVKSVLGVMATSNVPFPFEILDNLFAKHIPFDVRVMNPISNCSKYSKYNSKALNLGIYGADLAYSVTFEQFQQIGPYLKNTKKLAEDLNIDFAFNQEMMDKYNKFKDNKDSLTKVVFDSYSKVDKALKNDERIGISSLVVTGSWVEGLYLSTQTFINISKTNENKSLYKTIGEQKQSLLLVLNLLNEYKKDIYFNSLINDFNELSSDFNKINSESVLNDSQLKSINKKIEKLRSKIIEGY